LGLIHDVAPAQVPHSMLGGSPTGRGLVPLHFQSLQMACSSAGPPPPALRQCASAADLSRHVGNSGMGLHAGSSRHLPALSSYPMYGPGAPMAPLAELPHMGSPRTLQARTPPRACLDCALLSG
jgi:hypothetical protein